MDVALGQAFPEVYDVAEICQRNGFVGLYGALGAVDYGIEVGVHFIHPSLLVALGYGLGVDFGGDAHHSGYVGGLGLRARHAAKSGGHEQQSAGFAESGGALTPGGVENGYRCAVHDSLRTDIHIRSGCHLTVLAHAEGVQSLPVVGLGVVGYHHSVGHYNPRRRCRRGEESQRVARVHHERLFVGHLREVFHSQAVLGPVLKHGAVAPVGYEFVGMLGHARVQIVLNHHHDGRGLARPGRILVDWPGVHRILRTVAVHIYASVALQLVGEFGGEAAVELGGEIPQCVAQCELFLFFCEYVLTARGVVHLGVVNRVGRKLGGDACAEVVLKFLECHMKG